MNASGEPAAAVEGHDEPEQRVSWQAEGSFVGDCQRTESGCGRHADGRRQKPALHAAGMGSGGGHDHCRGTFDHSPGRPDAKMPKAPYLVDHTGRSAYTHPIKTQSLDSFHIILKPNVRNNVKLLHPKGGEKWKKEGEASGKTRAIKSKLAQSFSASHKIKRVKMIEVRNLKNSESSITSRFISFDTVIDKDSLI